MEFPGIVLNMDTFSDVRAPVQDTVYDMLIIGGGAAAMCAAVYAARKRLLIAVITLDFGGLMNETSLIENYLGFQSINARELVSRFEEHVKSYDIPVSAGVRISEIRKKGDLFTASLEDGKELSGHTVVFSTGEHHREISVPGAREFIGKGVSYCATCDAPFFKEKKVMVVGGGNSAFSTAIDLMRFDAEIILLNSRKGWQADEIFRQRLAPYGKHTLLDSHELLRIAGDETVRTAVIRNSETGQEQEVSLDGVFIEIGLVPNSGPVKDLVNLNEQGEVVIDCLCRTSLPGMFSAGDVTSIPYKQIIISAGEGAKAALSAYEYLLQTSQLS
jgi:alkyl hydroperoxide reductase subunit F